MQYLRLHLFEKGIALTCVFLILIFAALYVPVSVYVSTAPSDHLLPVYSVQRNDKKISLTFDSAWGNEDIPSILDTLAKYQIRASFFVTGSWIDSYPDDIKNICAAGHDIGNHSMSHPRMTHLSEEKIISELKNVHTQIKELTGQDMCLFRPPYGEYNNRLLLTASELGYFNILGNVDSEDWRDYGTEMIIQTVTQHKNLSSGSIILMHTGTKYTAAALEMIILSLLEAGYEFVPVSELIFKESYHINSAGIQVSD